MKRIPLLGGTNEEVSRDLDAQRTVNFFPVLGGKGSKTDVALVNTDGSTDFGNMITYGPILSYSNFIVTATLNPDIWELRRWDSNGEPTSSTNIISNFGIDELIAINGQRAAVELAQSDIVVAAVSGWTNLVTKPYTGVLGWFSKSAPASDGSIWQLGSSSTGFSESFPTAPCPTSIAYHEGYLVINHISTYEGDSNAGLWFVSNLGDYTFQTPTHFAKVYSTVNQDVEKVISCGGLLYLFTRKSVEIWYNSGNVDFPFEPIKEATKQVGIPFIGAAASYADYIIMVGLEDSGLGCYMMKGQEIKKISTPSIDNFFDTYLDYNKKRSRPLNSSDLGFYHPYNSGYVYGYKKNGHTFFCFPLKSNNTTEFPSRYFVYDLDSGLWHERTDFKINALSAFGKTLVVDNNLVSPGASVSYLNSNVFKDSSNSGNVVQRERITQHVSGEDIGLFHHRVHIDIEKTSLTNSNITLFSSNDDGSTWVSHGSKSYTNNDFLEWFRLGYDRDRIYKIQVNSNTHARVTGGFVDITPGTR